jgi:hypothetical protein
VTHLLDTHAWISRIRQWGRVPLLWRTSRG